MSRNTRAIGCPAEHTPTAADETGERKEVSKVSDKELEDILVYLRETGQLDQKWYLI